MHGDMKRMGRVACVLAAVLLAACDVERQERVQEPVPVPTSPTQVVVFHCEESGEHVALRWVDGQPELDIAGALYPLRPEVAASGARYLGPSLEFWNKGDEARLSREGRKPLSCRRDHHATVWAGARAAGVDFRALGNEPGWRLDIREDESLSLLLDYGQTKLQFLAPEREDENGVRRYRASLDGMQLQVVLEEKTCFDTMKGEAFSHHVSLRLDERQLAGCGRAP